MTSIDNRIDRIREIVADILEVEPEEISERGLFAEEHEADSLRAIEMLAQLEKEFAVEIPQEDLARMDCLAGVVDVLRERAGR